MVVMNVIAGRQKIIIAAFTVLIRPVQSVLLVLLIWKIVSELFYPHYELFEWKPNAGEVLDFVAMAANLQICE